MASVETCEYCGFRVAPSLDRCPHCAQPSRFPNVIKAGSTEEKDTLEARYKAACDEVEARQVGSAVKQFEEALAQHSQAVIARSLEEITRLANSENELYASFYNLVKAGVRIPSDTQWDEYRGRVDEALFPHYKEHIRFVALSLDDKGLINYGECSLVLRNDMIAHRATVFEENSMVFVKKRNIGLMEELPRGYRALWEDRGKLAVAKLSGGISSSITPGDFTQLLLKNGTNSGDDEFIEVHVYGSISIRTLKKISIRCSKEQQQSLRFKALQVKLNNLNVAFSVN